MERDQQLKIGGMAYYTLGAHKDDVAPALVNIDSPSILLAHDFHSLEPA